MASNRHTDWLYCPMVDCRRTEAVVTIDYIIFETVYRNFNYYVPNGHATSGETLTLTVYNIISVFIDRGIDKVNKFFWSIHFTINS